MGNYYTPSLFDFVEAQEQAKKFTKEDEPYLLKEVDNYNIEYVQKENLYEVYDIQENREKTHIATIDLTIESTNFLIDVPKEVTEDIQKEAGYLQAEHKATTTLKRDSFTSKTAHIIYPHMSRKEKEKHKEEIHRFLIKQIEDMKKELGGNILNDEVLENVQDISIIYSNIQNKEIIGFSLLEIPYQGESLLSYLAKLENKDESEYTNLKSEIKKYMPKLEDAGEKIEGARKFQYQDLNIETVKDMSEKEKLQHIKKKNIFPIFDKQRMKEEGYNPQLVAYLVAVRSSMPASITERNQEKFKKEIKNNEYKEKSEKESLTRYHEKIKSNKEKLDELDKDSSQYTTTQSKIDRYERWTKSTLNSLSNIKKAKNFTHNIDDTYLDEAEIFYKFTLLMKNALEDIPKSFSFEQAAMTLRRFLDKEGILLYEENKKRVSLGITGKLLRTIGFFQKKFFNLLYNIDNPKISSQFNNENWETLLSTKKINTTQRKESIATKLSKIEYLQEHTRIGNDIRQGKDILPDDFVREFGFRGVQFGNYLNNKERQQVMNKAYDAIKDFMQVMNLPDNAMGLNGTLGLAFGARGRGGKASAHYEPEQKVINLTKYSGAGSLAHEWAHALDHHLFIESGIGENRGVRNMLSDAKCIDSHYSENSVFNQSGYNNSTKTNEYYDYSQEQHYALISMGMISMLTSKASTKKNYSSHIDRDMEKLSQSGSSSLIVEQIKDDSIRRSPILVSVEDFSVLDNEVGHKLNQLSRRKGWRREYRLSEVKEIIENGASDFFKNSIKLDGSNWIGKKAYFSTRVERFARTMETLVGAALEEKGQRNDFLVGAIKLTNAYQEQGIPSPYPSKQEREELKPLFETFKESLSNSKVLTQGFGKRLTKEEIVEQKKPTKKSTKTIEMR